MMDNVREHAVSTDAVTPWYRQGWPWFLIALPATAVVGGIITALLAVRGFDGPVVADYYKQGLAINEEVARAQLARELAITAEAELAGPCRPRPRYGYAWRTRDVRPKTASRCWRAPMWMSTTGARCTSVRCSRRPRGNSAVP